MAEMAVDLRGTSNEVPQQWIQIRPTPDENQSPSGVGVVSDLMASTTETAVEAAEERPHFLMRAPPRWGGQGVHRKGARGVWKGIGRNWRGRKGMGGDSEELEGQ